MECLLSTGPTPSSFETDSKIPIQQTCNLKKYIIESPEKHIFIRFLSKNKLAQNTSSVCNGSGRGIPALLVNQLNIQNYHLGWGHIYIFFLVLHM